MSDHSTPLPEPKPFQLSVGIWGALLFLIGAGAVSLYIVAIEDATRAWFNFLIGSMLFAGFGLFGLFFLLINSVVAARWMVAIRRIPEAMATTLPLAALFFLIVYLGRDHLYEWTYTAIVEKDKILSKKTWWLDETFFLYRILFYITVVLGSAFYLVKNSWLQDKTGDVNLTIKNRNFSAVALVFFALAVTGIGMDFLMTLEPHWFSTIYGVYYFAGFFQAGLAAMYLFCWYLYTRGYFKDYLNSNHFHDIGKFIFAFSIFWAYIGFSQFMLYWYGNLAEETFWYIVRFDDGWQWIGLSLFTIRWVIPFFVLLPFANKMNFKIAVPVCVLLLFGQWIDLYWNAMPATRNIEHALHVTAGAADGHGHASHFGAMFGLTEVLVGLGFAALFFLLSSWVLSRKSIVPMKDPKLLESVHHHGH